MIATESPMPGSLHRFVGQAGLKINENSSCNNPSLGYSVGMKTNLTPSEIWKQIAGKAHLYQTAKLGTRYVKILRVVQDGTFSIQHPVFGEMHAGCHELTDYCL